MKSNIKINKLYVRSFSKLINPKTADKRKFNQIQVNVMDYFNRRQNEAINVTNFNFHYYYPPSLTFDK